MPALADILQLLGAISFAVSGVCSIVGQVIYARLPGARLFGFGFARYFYGEMRRTHPWIFVGSIGGVVGGLVLMFVARGLTR